MGAGVNERVHCVGVGTEVRIERVVDLKDLGLQRV